MAWEWVVGVGDAPSESRSYAIRSFLSFILVTNESQQNFVDKTFGSVSVRLSSSSFLKRVMARIQPSRFASASIGRPCVSMRLRLTWGDKIII